MNSRKLIECVPNFSEGRDMSIINKITDVIKSVDGVKLLDVDPGNATNRTVVTFVGEPQAVINAAHLAIKKAAELIDMSKHSGEHPRMGATDVCPLIPIANISMEETAEWAHKLGAMVGEDQNIPVYMYENAATKPEWRNLATVRSGEYEALASKLAKAEWKPDYGPAIFNAQSGATAISARDFLIAYNVNLNTTSTRRANSIAFDIREQGRVQKEGGKVNGKVMKDKDGNPLRVPGTCKSVKAIGWFIEEYGVAQISMNITNINDTSLHKAFEECDKSAQNRGIRVTGSELIGLVPKKVLIDAGIHFLKKQRRSIGIPELDIIHIAVKSMGLDELGPFDPIKKVIEYQLEDKDSAPLIHKTLKAFANETASESMAPGGGSVAAYVGALGISLGTMVANLSANRMVWDHRVDEFSSWAEKGQIIKDKLLNLVDEDTHSYNGVIAAIRLPKKTEAEKIVRLDAIEKATQYAASVPLEVMKTCLASFDVILGMAKDGNPNSSSDAGVGALCARAGVRGAWLNVKINVGDLNDKAFVENILAEGAAIVEKAEALEKEVMGLIE